MARQPITSAVLGTDLPEILATVTAETDPTPAFLDPHGATMQLEALQVLRRWYAPSREWLVDDCDIPQDVIDLMATALSRHYAARPTSAGR